MQAGQADGAFWSKCWHVLFNKNDRHLYSNPSNPRCRQARPTRSHECVFGVCRSSDVATLWLDQSSDVARHVQHRPLSPLFRSTGQRWLILVLAIASINKSDVGASHTCRQRDRSLVQGHTCPLSITITLISLLSPLLFRRGVYNQAWFRLTA